MEQKAPEPQQAQTPDKPKEPLVSKPVLIIVGSFLALNILFAAFVLWPKLAGGKDEKKAAEPTSPLADLTMVELGRLEITKPIDPLQQNYMRVTVTIQLQIVASRAAEVEPRIKKFEGLFKEQARKAFRDADARDLASENLIGVKNAIKARVNEALGEDVVKDVICADFTPH
jgi:hypothetical protein